MPTEKIIVFDLEWNGGRGDIILNEIFEIGAVKLDHFGGPVVDTFHALIKPVVHHSLNAAARCFAPSEAELAAGGTFAEVFEQFLTWCGENSQYASWGPCDLKELSANASFWNLDFKLPECVYDIQAAAGLMVQTPNRVALHTMVEYCGVPDALDFHDAVNDSFYAAIIAEVIFTQSGEDGLLTSVIPNSMGLSAEELRQYVMHTGPEYTGFPQEHALLNSRGIRRQNCPVCGSHLLITCWFPIEEYNYITKVSCPEHEDQFFWATIHHQKKGRWRGEVHVLKPEPVIKALYSGRDKLHFFQCRRSRRLKRKDAYKWYYFNKAELTKRREPIER